MLIDNDGPCDLLAGIVAGDCCRLGVDTRLRRELRGLAAEQALLFISTGDLGIIDHHAVRLQQSADIVCLSLGQRHPGGQVFGPVEADALGLGLYLELATPAVFRSPDSSATAPAI